MARGKGMIHDNSIEGKAKSEHDLRTLALIRSGRIRAYEDLMSFIRWEQDGGVALPHGGGFGAEDE